MVDKKRLERLKRMIRLQQRLKQKHEWTLVELQHQKARLAEEKMMLSETLYKPQSSSERLLELIGNQLVRASQKEHGIGLVEKYHQQQQSEHHQRFKYMERVHDIAAGDYQRGLDGKELSETIDLALLRKVR